MADPITNYATLIAAVESYLARDDLQSYARLFVQQAEGWFNTNLKVVDMHKTTGGLNITDGGIALPSDFIDWVALRWAPTSEVGQRSLYLRYVEADSPEFRTRHRPNGPPQFYTLLAGKVRVMPPAPGAAELIYYARIPPLSDAAPTNWLIEKAPEVYLYGTLMEAMLFQKDEDRSAQWFSLLDKRLAAIFGQGDTQKVGTRQTRAAVDVAEDRAAKVAS